MFSLGRRGKDAQAEAVWRVEPDSIFPDRYSQKTGEQCRSLHEKTYGNLIPNFRQSIATATLIYTLRQYWTYIYTLRQYHPLKVPLADFFLLKIKADFFFLADFFLLKIKDLTPTPSKGIC